MVTSVETKRSKGMVALAGAAMAWGVAYSLPQMSHAALLSNVVFNDTLATNGSTMGSASVSYPHAASPTATSTNYDVAAGKDGTASNLNSGSPLELKMVSTSGGVNEVQAIFTSSPVVLTNAGDAVELTATFVNNAGLNQNASSSVDIGLYGSGGNAPYSNMANGSSTTNTITGLNNTTGGTKGWVGFEADYFGGSSTKLYTRPNQGLSTNNVDQALVADGQTGGPTGTGLAYTGQNSSETTLTIGNTYTDEVLITLSAPNTYVISEALYNGATDTGTQVGTTTTSTATSLTGISGFDGLAIGYRESDSLASEMDISQVEVTTNVAIPEPMSFSLLGISGMALMLRRRKA
jgi:hypothetical protein